MSEKIYEEPVMEFIGVDKTDIITESGDDDLLYNYIDPFDKWGL